MALIHFVIGAALRLFMAASGKSLWSDELFSLELAQKPLFQVITGSIQDVHPPVYFLLLHAVVKTLGPSEWALRLLSLLGGVGVLWVLYLLTKELLGEREARWTLLFTAVSPYWLQSSNEIRGYSLLAFVTVSATFFLFKALGEPGRKRWGRAYWAAGTLAVYIEHYAWFWLGAATIYLTWRYFKEGKGGGVIAWHRAILFSSLPSLALVIYQSLYREGIFQVERLKEYLAFPILVKKMVGVLWHFSCGYHYSMLTVERIKDLAVSAPFFWLSAAVAFGAAFLAGRALARLYRMRRGVFVFCFASLIFPIFFLSVFYSIRLDARYLSFAAPFFFLLLAEGLSASGPFLRAAFGAAFLLVSLAGSAEALWLKTDAIHKEDYKGLVVHVSRNASEKDAIAGFKPAVNYYQRELNLEFRAAYFNYLTDLPPASSSAFERVWVMEGTNMHPDEARRQRENLEGILGRLGYVPTAPPRRFGGPAALTLLYLFQPGETRAA